MVVKKNDFIDISFVGKIKSNNLIFDLTDESTAKKCGIYNPKTEYGPKKICVGQKHIIPGLDKQLEGKEIGKKYIIEVSSNEAFGKKYSELIKTINTNTFRKEKINPFPGLQITADGLLGIVRSVTGGRTVVDFNHPLAGKDLVYEIIIVKEINDDLEKLKVLLLNELGLKKENYELKEENKECNISLKVTIPKEIKEKFIERVKELIPSIKVKF